MIDTLRRFRFAKVLLCVLIAVESTSTSIQHSHEEGESPHAHGFGISGWFFSPTTAGGDAREGCQSSRPHSHIIFLGFEFYEGEVPPSDSQPSSPWAPEGTQVTPGMSAVVSDETCLRTSSRSSVAILPPFLLDGPVVLTPPSRAERSREPAHSARCLLCDRARGERSGVRQT